MHISILELIKDSGVEGYIIVALGIFAFALILERIKYLYIDYTLKAENFMKQIKGYILSDNIEEAVTLCNTNSKAPLAHVIKGILERANRDDEAIQQGLEVSMSEVIPHLGRRLGFLAMISNVATLMGLFGTIRGLILAFQAVSFADPAQKQTLLAQGISLSMYTTALGLAVAIPVLFTYSFLHSKQSILLEQIVECSTKVVDWLTTRHYRPFSMSSAFPDAQGADGIEKHIKTTPPAHHLKSG